MSESALSSRIKSARKAVGDDGRRQEVIRTVHGRGFRIVAHVENLGGRPPEADVAALRVVPPLLEAIPVLLDALVRTTAPHAVGRPAAFEAAEDWAGSEPASGWESYASQQIWEYIEPGWDSDASPEVGFIALAGALIPDAFTTAVGQTVGKPADR